MKVLIVLIFSMVAMGAMGSSDSCYRDIKVKKSCDKSMWNWKGYYFEYECVKKVTRDIDPDPKHRVLSTFESHVSGSDYSATLEDCEDKAMGIMTKVSYEELVKKEKEEEAARIQEEMRKSRSLAGPKL